MPPRPDVHVLSWLGEDPSLEPLIDPLKKRATEDLHLHAHVRALMLSKELWTGREVRAFLQVKERTWRRITAEGRPLRALAIDVCEDGGPPVLRWPAGVVVTYYLSRRKGRVKDGA